MTADSYLKAALLLVPVWMLQYNCRRRVKLGRKRDQYSHIQLWIILSYSMPAGENIHRLIWLSHALYKFVLRNTTWAHMSTHSSRQPWCTVAPAGGPQPITIVVRWWLDEVWSKRCMFLSSEYSVMEHRHVMRRTPVVGVHHEIVCATRASISFTS